MALTREATLTYPGHKVGDLKMAHYALSYTAGAITKPTNDPNWILLNGASLSTTTYAALFAIYGYAYGGSGANFNLPDLTEGRVPIGQGLTNFTTMGASGGEITHTLTSAEMPSHAHATTLAWSANSHAHSSSGSMSNTDDQHAHTMNDASDSGDNQANIGISPYPVSLAVGTASYNTSGVSADHSHGGSWGLNANSGGSGDGMIHKTGSVTSTVQDGSGNNVTAGQSHNNMQPYIVIGGWLVKFQ